MWGQLDARSIRCEVDKMWCRLDVRSICARNGLYKYSVMINPTTTWSRCLHYFYNNLITLSALFLQQLDHFVCIISATTWSRCLHYFDNNLIISSALFLQQLDDFVCIISTYTDNQHFSLPLCTHINKCIVLNPFG